MDWFWGCFCYIFFSQHSLSVVYTIYEFMMHRYLVGNNNLTFTTTTSSEEFVEDLR